MWAGHEMDGALTRSDKQPGPINIPLSLVSFFFGRGKRRNLMLPDRCLGLTGNRTDPHVAPPVAQIFA